MLSEDLLLFFQKDLKLQKQWWVNGKHYAKTSEVSCNSARSAHPQPAVADLCLGLAFKDGY